MSSFTFADGTHVPEGNLICVPQQAVMQDPAIYTDPTVFHPFRFVTSTNGTAKSEARFSHPSRAFPFWGAVGRAWSVTTLECLACSFHGYCGLEANLCFEQSRSVLRIHDGEDDTGSFPCPL